MTFEPGCVLLDIRMPKMSCMEVQEKLKSIQPDLPVIIVTGHGDVTMAVQEMRGGAINFIEKPFDEDFLLASIENAPLQAEQLQQKDGASLYSAKPIGRPFESARYSIS